VEKGNTVDRRGSRRRLNEGSGGECCAAATTTGVVGRGSVVASITAPFKPHAGAGG